ncbi:hypothetical protein J6590_047396 [Homalodisca vitripennis]|nr:hypothetical protein J6590_047396 [Homalodisca vitripennis]
MSRPPITQESLKNVDDVCQDQVVTKDVAGTFLISLKEIVIGNTKSMFPWPVIYASTHVVTLCPATVEVAIGRDYNASWREKALRSRVPRAFEGEE